MRMHNPHHLGEILYQMWLKPLDLTLTRTALELKISCKTLSGIVNGKAAITPEMALRLELAFGKSAASWLGHQAAFDLWKIQDSRESMGVQRMA